MMAYESINHAVEFHRAELRRLCDAIYQYPELAFEETFAAETLGEFLEEHGYISRIGVGQLQTAFTAVRGTGGPVVAFLAEYDALPELGHACGHNLIATAACGAALALASLPEEIAGEIRVVGCPAEEKGGGKALLIQSGTFRDVDVALMFHPGNETVLAPEYVGAQWRHIAFYGKAVHAGVAPETGLNALEGLLSTFYHVNALRQQFPDGSGISGIITHGGDAANIVPHYAAGEFIARGFSQTALDQMVHYLETSATSAAMATGTRVEISVPSPPYELLRTNQLMIERFESYLSGLGFPIHHRRKRRRVGTDMGNVSQLIPAIHPVLAISPLDVPNHTAEFARLAGGDAAFDVALVAAKTLACVAYDCLTDSEFLIEVRGTK